MQNWTDYRYCIKLQQKRSDILNDIFRHFMIKINEIRHGVKETESLQSHEMVRKTEIPSGPQGNKRKKYK